MARLVAQAWGRLQRLPAHGLKQSLLVESEALSLQLPLERKERALRFDLSIRNVCGYRRSASSKQIFLLQVMVIQLLPRQSLMHMKPIDCA